MATLALVTVLFKSDDVLEDFFHSLSIQTYTDYHLYLIDNSVSPATDELIERFTKQYNIPAYTHVKNEGNFGVAKGNNQGIKLGLEEGADLVILLNNDIEFKQSYLFHDLVKTATEQKEDLVFPKVMYHGTRKIQIAGGGFNHYKGVSYGYGVGDDDGEKYNTPGHTGYAPTCFLLISRKVFETIGYMDETYFVYYDDDDFIYRALKHGFKLYFAPHLEIFHKASFSTGGHESPFSVYQLNRNRVYFIRKHYSFPLRQIALSQMVATKTIRYLFFYDKANKQALSKALKDGFFKMKVGK